MDIFFLDHISLLNVTEGPKTTKRKNKLVNTIDHNKAYISVSHFSSMNLPRQRDAVTTKVNNNLSSFLKSKQHKCSSSQFKTKKSTMLLNQRVLCSPLQLTKKEYFKKFLKCFRRKNMTPIIRSEKQK